MSNPPPAVTFRVPLYGGTVQAYACAAEFAAEYKATAKGPELRPANGCCATLHDRAGNITYMVGVFDGRLHTLVHELTHCALFVLERAGIDAHSNKGECLAHLLEGLLMECTPIARHMTTANHNTAP